MVTKEERRWIWVFGIILMMITTLPYIIGYARQGAGWRYTGFVFGVEDGNSYIAKMLSGASGAWLFRTPYTAYPQNGFLAFLPYLLLGKLTAPPGQHEQLTALFQIYRWVGGLLMVLASYDFIALFVENTRLRRLGTALVVAGGGLGWLSLIGLQELWKSGLPLEFYSPETFGFMSIYGIPHLAAGRAFLLWGMRAFLGDSKARWKSVFQAAGFWTLLGFMQPLTVVIGWTVVGAYVVVGSMRGWIRQRLAPERLGEWKIDCIRIAGLIGLTSPFVIYTGYSFWTDSYLQLWAKQNLIMSPPLVDYILAYGLAAALVFYWYLAARDKLGINLLLICWSVILLPLAYFPYPLQRRLTEGGWTALVILSISALPFIHGRFKKLILAFIGLSFLPAIVLVFGGCLSTWAPRLPLFRPVEEIAIFQDLVTVSHPGDVVLANYEISNALPAWAPVHTLIGHGPESIHLVEVEKQVDEFFLAETTDSFREDLIHQFNIAYILVPYGQHRSDLLNPDDSTFINAVSKNERYALYKIVKR